MKKERQAAITRLIDENVISTQEELLDLLIEAGFAVTQATVSRDIKEMHIVKHPAPTGDYKYCLPVTPGEEYSGKYMSILMGSAYATDVAMNTVVVKCHIGTAQAACAALDSIALQGIAGTIAGDDTIFVLCYTTELALKVKEKLDSILGF